MGEPTQKESGDGEKLAQSGGNDRESDFIDRHLVKIIVIVAVVCCIGLVGRAMAG